MEHAAYYPSPLGQMLLTADEAGLTGAWFEGEKYYPQNRTYEWTATPALEETIRYLRRYFSGERPEALPPLHPTGSEFQHRVWRLLLEIPYGQTTTYGALAKALGGKSAQAVGGAVGRNPISILVPCHRVVGADRSLTGYAGGLSRKMALLRLEGVDTGSFSLPSVKNS